MEEKEYEYSKIETKKFDNLSVNQYTQENNINNLLNWAYFLSLIGCKGKIYSVIFDVFIVVICYIYTINCSFRFLEQKYCIKRGVKFISFLEEAINKESKISEISEEKKKKFKQK